MERRYGRTTLSWGVSLLAIAGSLVVLMISLSRAATPPTDVAGPSPSPAVPQSAGVNPAPGV